MIGDFRDVRLRSFTIGPLALGRTRREGWAVPAVDKQIREAATPGRPGVRIFANGSESIPEQWNGSATLSSPEGRRRAMPCSVRNRVSGWRPPQGRWGFAVPGSGMRCAARVHRARRQICCRLVCRAARQTHREYRALPRLAHHGHVRRARLHSSHREAASVCGPEPWGRFDFG
jgi:hypothetical protein